MNNLKSIFQTEGDAVHSILNIDLGVNLAAIGNKLYLVHCGDLPVNTPTTTTTTTTLSIAEKTAIAQQNIMVTYPNGGEFLLVGETTTIRWTSQLGVNEGIKIELYNGEILSFVIASKTSNSGAFDWDVPLDLNIGANYRIKLTRLTAETTPSASNFDFSDNYFNVVQILPQTTTTTTTEAPSKTLPDTSNCQGIPILELPENEYITNMIKDEARGGILFATSRGRILGCSKALVNAYLTGDRRVFAEVSNGFGNVSNTAWTNLFYSLYNRIAEINENKEIVKWHYETTPTAILIDRITATFLSPILLVKQDLGFWKQLIWNEQKPDDTNITICIRSANTQEELQAKSWDNCFESNDTDIPPTITRDLDDISMDGKYIQFKVIMSTESDIEVPVVISLSISYSTKFAVYFFTTKFSLKNQTNLKRGLWVADVTEPQNTEISFGICNTNSAEWTDYQVIDLNKFFSLDNFENIKAGIKFVSYGDNIPAVGEFSIMSGGEKINLIN